jgi:hypothetical protein
MTILLNSSATFTDGTRGPTSPTDPEGPIPMIFRILMSEPVPIRRQAGGYCAEGPGFYVWDEDPREVSRMVRAFRGGAGNAIAIEEPTEDESVGS